MTSNGLVFDAVRTAPGHPNQPYLLQSFCGEIIYIPCSRSATRLLVTGKETDDSFAVVGSGGAQGAPIGFHFHREAHDVFLCLKGNINVWANDQCRTLSVGDFASVPPGAIHQYQILGDYTEFIGLIVPGGWEEFFRFIGEPYDGPMFPLEDNRNVFEVLIPKLKAAAEKFDMVPVPHHPSVDPQPWSQETDTKLPGEVAPYFLRAGSAPKYVLGGVVASVLASSAETAGRFTIGLIEGSAWHESGPLSESFTFEGTHHALYVADGSFALTLNKKQTANVTSGEIIYIPRGHAFTIAVRSRYAKAYVFSNGDSIVSVLAKAGQTFNGPLPPEVPHSWEKSSLEGLQSAFQFKLE